MKTLIDSCIEHRQVKIMEITFFQLLVNIKLIITIIHLMIMMIKMVATIRRVFKGFQQLPFNARSSVSISPSPPLLFCQPLELHALLSRKKAAAEIRKKREGEWRGGEFAIHRSRKPRDEDIIVIRGRVFKRGKNAKEGGRGGEGRGGSVGRRKREEMGCTCPQAR